MDKFIPQNQQCLVLSDCTSVHVLKIIWKETINSKLFFTFTFNTENHILFHQH